MRKIEEKIISTIKLADGFNGVKTVNLSERDTVKINNGAVNVYLWGNCIFKCCYSNGKIVDAAFNFCGWVTNTTKSRINACLTLVQSHGCNISKSAVLIGGLEVPSSEWVSISTK
jgi:hypothetical protein